MLLLGPYNPISELVYQLQSAYGGVSVVLALGLWQVGIANKARVLLTLVASLRAIGPSLLYTSLGPHFVDILCHHLDEIFETSVEGYVCEVSRLGYILTVLSHLLCAIGFTLCLITI